MCCEASCLLNRPISLNESTVREYEAGVYQLSTHLLSFIRFFSARLNTGRGGANTSASPPAPNPRSLNRARGTLTAVHGPWRLFGRSCAYGPHAPWCVVRGPRSHSRGRSGMVRGPRPLAHGRGRWPLGLGPRPLVPWSWSSNLGTPQ